MASGNFDVYLFDNEHTLRSSIFLNVVFCSKNTGKCICNELTEGFACETCKPCYWVHTSSSNGTCRPCECDYAGTNNDTLLPSSGGRYVCDPKTSQCTCNKNRIGFRCETCATGYFYLGVNDIDCEQCNCDPVGSIPGSNCNSLTGECSCKVGNGIGGTACDICDHGYYNFSRTTGT